MRQLDLKYQVWKLTGVKENFSLIGIAKSLFLHFRCTSRSLPVYPVMVTLKFNSKYSDHWSVIYLLVRNHLIKRKQYYESSNAFHDSPSEPSLPSSASQALPAGESSITNCSAPSELIPIGFWEHERPPEATLHLHRKWQFHRHQERCLDSWLRLAASHAQLHSESRILHTLIHMIVNTTVDIHIKYIGQISHQNESTSTGRAESYHY